MAESRGTKDKSDNKPNINWRKINQLRKLSRNTPPNKEPHIKSSGSCTISRFLFILFSCFAAAIGIFYYKPHFEGKVITIINEHTDDTCQSSFDSSIIIQKLRDDVLHQDLALSDINRLMRNHKDVSAMSIIGPTGTGKTMTANIMQQQFPWPSNVIHILWSSSQRTLGAKGIYDSVIWKLSTCGHNLLVVDDISPGMITQISEFHQHIIDYLHENSKKAIIVFVFSVPTFMDDQLLNLQQTVNRLAVENNANGIEPILYQSIISKDDVRLCVEKAKMQLELSQISNQQIDEIVASIDAPRSGCKQVYAKTALYA